MPTCFPGMGGSTATSSPLRGGVKGICPCVRAHGVGEGKERAAVPLSPHQHCPLLLEAFLPTSPGSLMPGMPDKTQAAQFNLNFRSAMNAFWRYGSTTRASWNTLILAYYSLSI